MTARLAPSEGREVDSPIQLMHVHIIKIHKYVVQYSLAFEDMILKCWEESLQTSETILHGHKNTLTMPPHIGDWVSMFIDYPLVFLSL